MRYAVLALIALPCLSACLHAQTQADLPDCAPPEFANLIGQPRDAIPADLPPRSRVIPVGTPVTKDYRPDRINIDLDDNDQVVRIWCG